MSRLRQISLLLNWVIVLLCTACLSCWSFDQKDEENTGRKYAAEVAQSMHLLVSGAQVDRVKRVGAAIAKIANETEVPAHYGSSQVFKFDYQFSVIEDKDVNAFSLPGGHIYVNTGLLDLAKSDDELAGVLAHEVAHSAHHHVAALERKETQADRYVALIALAGILGGMRGEDLNNVLLGAQLLKTGKESGFTMQAERDADRTAVAYLVKSQYNPEGMLSFMKKLDTLRDENPTLPEGIYQDHPAPFKRVAAIVKALKEEGIKTNLREAQDIAYARSVPVKEGSDQYEVVISKRIIFKPASLGSGPTSKQRAEEIAKSINTMLDSGKAVRRISTDTSGDRLLINSTEILKAQAEDLLLAKQSDRALLDNARSALAYAVWADWLCNDCQDICKPLASSD